MTCKQGWRNRYFTDCSGDKFTTRTHLLLWISVSKKLFFAFRCEEVELCSENHAGVAVGSECEWQNCCKSTDTFRLASALKPDLKSYP